MGFRRGIVGMSLKRAPASSEKLFFVRCPAGAPARLSHPGRSRCWQGGADKSGVFQEDLLICSSLSWDKALQFRAALLASTPVHPTSSGQRCLLPGAHGVVPTRQQPLDLRSFRSHRSSRRTHQEDRCAVGQLSPGKGEFLGLHELLANQENKAVPSATASFKRLLHMQANNTAFLQRLKSCLHAQRKHLQSST